MPEVESDGVARDVGDGGDEELAAHLGDEGYETEFDPKPDGEGAQDGFSALNGWADGLGGGKGSHRLCDEGTARGCV